MTCFDNNSLRWAFQAFSSAAPPTDPFVQRVGNYILSLDQADQKVVIPAIVLFEFLVIEPENEHQRLIAGFAERFEIIPFPSIFERHRLLQPYKHDVPLQIRTHQQLPLLSRFSKSIV